MKIGPNLGNGIVEKSKTRVSCIFCGVCIPKAPKCIEQHTNGSKHQENMELMLENGIKFVGTGLECKICKRALAEDESVTKHIETADHANWMAAAENLTDGEYIQLDDFLSTDQEDVFCEVCQCSFVCTLPALETHANSLDHRTKLANKLKSLNGLFAVQNADELWCKVCNDYIENSTDGILDHIGEYEHIEFINQLEFLIENNDITIDEYLSNEFKDKAFCTRCNVEIPCTPESIESHIFSDEHTTNQQL